MALAFDRHECSCSPQSTSFFANNNKWNNSEQKAMTVQMFLHYFLKLFFLLPSHLPHLNLNIIMITSLLQINFFPGDSERLDVLIVDTENLETKVRITIDRLGMVEGFDSMDRCLTVPFISLCRNYFAMLFWVKQWRATMPTWAVATFKVEGLLTHVLTLKQLARISILRSTKVSNTFCLPLPETLKDYLVN